MHKDMNSYVPFQQNKAWEKNTPFNNSSSKPRYTSHILGRRFALTLTANKYLDIGINVGPTSFVELFIGDNQEKEREEERLPLWVGERML
ncbi:PREDICTED: uncharacterized protein LOC108751162 isoform X2 [Trachymyrmex septentrionalis]|uniref:uncharacterized protein LOC108751162 isoform X2 n=1 Tax=Trachymyrmex septentrionalis TaxID=34720 RepID=UPI00084F5AD3|nr:PREDICTED: uncharacterized protein LOC108751162 isoform X2 [Trachymyrmex septentrionalis]